MDTVHQLRRVAVAFNELGARFAIENDLHPTDLRAIICLLDAARAGTPATPGWLGRQLRLNPASVTALIDRLERAGHVRRDRDPDDRRRVRLLVEPSAQKLGWEFFGPVITRIAGVAGALRPRELAVVNRFLAAILEATHD